MGLIINSGQARSLAYAALKQAKQGDFVAVLGHNGSGKSTFAKHLNALVMPTEGTVWVDGMDTREEENTLKVRQTAGMVFQNPDNQIVGTLVDEEVGFGPENIGVPTEEIWFQKPVAKQAIWRTEAEGSDCGNCSNEAKMYCIG